MVIQRSSAAQTARLIDDLIGGDPVRREAAAARLAIVGERAVERLLAALPPLDGLEATTEATVNILRVLEVIGSPRALPAALARVNAADDGVAVAAINVVKPFLRADDDGMAARSLGALTSVALESGRSDGPRLAALEALNEMDAETLAPIRERLLSDLSLAIRRMAGSPGSGDEPAAVAAESPAQQLEAAAHGTLPENGEVLRALLLEAGPTVALSVLHDLVLALRTKERAAADASNDALELDWMAARATAHQTLADRQSRLAVFDLRDTFEHASARLPVGFLDAVARIGDQSVLAALALAWQRVDDRWMRDHLAAAFQEILARERLTRRHAAVRKALERAPEAAEALTKAAARAAR